MFIIPLKQFISNLNSLRDFVDFVDPILTRKQGEEGKKNSKNLLPMLLALNKIDPQAFPITDKAKKELDKLEFNFKYELKKNDDPEKPSVSIQISDDKDGVFSKAFGSFIKIKSQKDHLYKTSLISLISSAEWFISQLLHTYYEKYPDSFNKNEKLLSIEDIKSIGGIDEAINYLIDIKIEEILRGSIKDWIDHFKSHFKLSMSYIENDIDSLIEAGLRRNILIHNNGIVNSLFMKKVPVSFQKEYKLNFPIPIDQNYVDKAITLFEKNFILIAAELWKKIDLEDHSRGKFLIEVAYDNILAKRYDIGESLSYFVMNDKKLPEEGRMVASINYWQSKKWQGHFEEIKKEVEDADFSAKEEKFKLAKYALLDEVDNFFDCLPKALKSEQITEEDVLEWPLFKNIRETEKFKNEFKDSKPPNKRLNPTAE